MQINEFQEFIIELFTKEKLDIVKDKREYGFTNIGKAEVLKVGYCTNLTVETAQAAVECGIDLLVTHHDAWEWMGGLKEEALNILRQKDISHFYIHLPLDDAEFGNNTSILNKLDFKVVEKFCNEEGMYCGRVGEIQNGFELSELVNKLENLLEEPVRYWKNNDMPIKRIGVVTGAGFSSNELREAIELGCNAYITGEKMLYTIQYAKYKKINLIVTSHTFIEVYGLESLTNILKDKYPELGITRIKEEHIE